MRLEVIEGSEDPVIYPFNNSKLVLGSGENCDIIVHASGISRKHLIITSENDQFFVVDQGSTNGSFINEERLIPGKKVEFTSFFPVRLGENVLISLLSDEEGFDSEFESSLNQVKERTSPSMKAPAGDSTTVISLRDLQKVKTNDLVLERNKKREVRKKTQGKKTPAKPKKKTNYMAWFVFILIASAGYYNYRQAQNVETENVSKVGQIVEITPVAQEAVKKSNNNLIEDDDIPKKEYVTSLLNNLKCTTEAEKYLCSTLPSANGGQFGVVQVGLSLIALVDGLPYYNDAIQRVPNKDDIDLIQRTTALLYLSKLPELNLELLKEARISIGMLFPGEGDLETKILIAIKPEVLNREKNQFSESRLRYLKSVGSNVFEVDKTLYKVR